MFQLVPTFSNFYDSGMTFDMIFDDFILIFNDFELCFRILKIFEDFIDFNIFMHFKIIIDS